MDVTCRGESEQHFLLGGRRLQDKLFAGLAGSRIRAVAREAEQAVENALGEETQLVVNVRIEPEGKQKE